MKKLKELADKIAAEHGLEWYQPLNKAEDSAGMTAIDLGNGYSLHHEHSDNGHDIWSVGCNGERAGTFMLKTEDTRRGKPMVAWAGLEKAHRGKGIGTLAYKALAAHYGGIDSDKASSSDDAIKAWVRAGGRQMKIKTQFGKPRYTLDGDKKNPPIVWNEDLKKTGWGEWQPEDLDDAIQYQTDAYGKKINQNKLQYSHTELMDPDDFENDLSAHTGANEKGWLKQFPKSEWSERFTEEYGSNLGHIPKLYFSGSMNPGIAINGAFGDGRHRSLFYHAIGENMPVAHFFTNKKYKKNEDLVKGARGDWEKEGGYTLSHELADGSQKQPKHGDEFGVFVHKNGKLIGNAFFRHHGNYLQATDDDGLPSVSIDPEHRRKGIASALYQYAEKISDTGIIPSEGRTEAGKAFWAQSKRPFGKSAPSHSLHLINKFEGSDFAPTEFHYSVKSNGKEIGRAIVFDKDPRSIHQAGKTGPSLKDIRLHPDYQGQGHSQGIINKLVDMHGPLASDSRGNISPAGAKMFHKYGIKQPDESYILHGQSLKKSDHETLKALGYSDSSDDYYNDIQDAIDHHNLISNRLGERYGNLSENYDLKVQHPHEVIPQLKEIPQQFGWLKQYPAHEWEDRLKQAYPDRKYSYALKAKQKGELSPAVVINGKLSDGFGRVHLAHALGENIPVMYHKRKKLTKSISLNKSSDIDSLIQQAKARLEGVKKVGSQEPRPMIFASKDGKRHAFVTVDPSKKGQWRVTHFVNSKPAGHTEAPTFSHAIKVAHESGYNVFKEISENKMFDKPDSLKKSEDKTRVASIVVCSGDKMLMLQRRDNDKWTFPGGHLNNGESFIDGAVRELWEEAGIKANPDELILLGDKQTFQGKTIHVYLYKVNNEVATTASNDPDKEAKQFKWLPHVLPEEIKENLYIPVGDNASLSMFTKYLLSQKVQELKNKLKKD